MASSLPFIDMLSIPYEDQGDDPKRGLDCIGVCREVMRRAGLEVPPRDAFSIGSERWERLGATYKFAEKIGDVVVSAAKNVDGRDMVADHVSVVVAEDPVLVMSSHNPHGVIQGRAFAVRNVLGVYRWV